jgi:hypothetical protein
MIFYVVVVHKSRIAIWFEAKHFIHDFPFELHEFSFSFEHKFINFVVSFYIYFS